MSCVHIFFCSSYYISMINLFIVDGIFPLCTMKGNNPDQTLTVTDRIEALVFNSISCLTVTGLGNSTAVIRHNVRGPLFCNMKKGHFGHKIFNRLLFCSNQNRDVDIHVNHFKKKPHLQLYPLGKVNVHVS